MFKPIFALILSLSGVLAACPFCDQNIVQLQTFYESEHSRALISYRAIYSGHTLVVPKRHVERFEDLSADELLDIQLTAQKVTRAVMAAFNVQDTFQMQKNGVAAGQTVPHYHLHIIPIPAGNTTAKFVYNMTMSNVYSAMTPEQIAAAVTVMKERLE
jgi:diadenosine tetraphosphate (Ap4A) HIT family hydrolase